MSKPIASIKDRLQRAMSLTNTSPIELSKGTGIPKSSISQYMSGYAKPKQDRIYLIAEHLKVDPAWLLGYDVPMTRDIKVVKNDKKADIVLTDNIFIEIMTPNSFQKLSELNKDDRTKVEEYIDFLHSKKQY